ncbi:hypothetical protein DFQ27_008363 [Actinomortierella ambigua]|uniref:Nudix hydrolase 3 n=1 Tax=Actinomortierella ambigua TaxID=1343610 RepID=A0A9P6QNV2_9FUNG|nr:hypothetical protein DFQ27_008363 [Actinomortierella ambigua]
MSSSQNMSSVLTRQLAQFKEIKVGGKQYLGRLTEGDRKALPLLVQVGKLVDEIYIRQRWSQNERLHQYIAGHRGADDPTTAPLPDKKERLLLGLRLFKGPWGLDEERFIDSILAKDGKTVEIEIKAEPPHNGHFYPDDMTMEEYQAWVATLTGQAKLDAESYYHVVKRDPATKKLYTVPYSVEYQDLLQPAAKLLEEAATLVSDASLRKFLQSRAKAFGSNDYTDSDVDWLRISAESTLEVTVGPYENYTDKLLSLRAAYEFYVHARDFDSSAILEKFSSRLQDIEDQLPIEDQYKAKDLFPPAIVAVNQLYSGGDVAVPMTAAYNLPNDEKPIAVAGSKLVIIKNVQEGKFEQVLRPIAEQVLEQDQLGLVAFESFFNHVLMHEVAHSNGPHFLVHDKKATVRSALEEYHSAMEEAKADIAGLWAIALLLKDGTLDPKPTAASYYATFLASAFRSIRFGITEAHGLGQCIQFEFLMEQGGFEYNATTDKFRVNLDKIEAAVTALTNKIMVLQGDGDKAAVKAFIQKYGKISPHVAKALARLEALGVPVDVYPRYSILEDGTF